VADVLTADGELTYASFPIEKVEETADGNVLVWGKATDGSVDSDEQIVDPAFAAKAIDEFFTSGPNIRVQHQPQRDPAGVGISYERDGNAHWVKSKIIEPVAKQLVLGGALRAYSVGIARPTIVRDGVARGGRITDGMIVEISLVDRPANKNCGIQLVKAAKDGTMEWIGKAWGSPVLEKSDTAPGDVTITLPADVQMSFSPMDMAKIVAKRNGNDPELVPFDAISKGEESVLGKESRHFSAESRRTIASHGNALPDGSYPIPDADALRRAAILARSKHGDWKAARRLISRRARELGVANPLKGGKGDSEKGAAMAEPDKDVTTTYHGGVPGGSMPKADDEDEIDKEGTGTMTQSMPHVPTAKGKKEKLACVACGAMQNKAHGFCSECGAKMDGAMPLAKNHDFMCLGCGKTLDKGERFCPDCGKENPGHNPMADQKIPANKAEGTRVADAEKAMKPKKKGNGKPFGGNQAPAFGSDDADSKKAMKKPKKKMKMGKVPPRMAEEEAAEKAGFGHTATPGEGVAGEHTMSVPRHREPDGAEVEMFERDAGLPTNGDSNKGLNGMATTPPPGRAGDMHTESPRSRAKRKKNKKPSMPMPPVSGSHGAHAMPDHGDVPGSPDETFDRDAASKSGDPEVGAAMRLKSLGVDAASGYIHDLTCPAYSYGDVTKAYPTGFERFSADDWQAKALEAAATAPLAEAQAASQLGQHAFTIKSADVNDLADVKNDLYKAFRDANPGPSSFPSPSEICATHFQRPKVTTGLAAYSHQYDAPNSANVPSGSIAASGFTRTSIGGTASMSPAQKGENTTPYPTETGQPVNLNYSSVHKANLMQALKAMHDHFERIMPAGVCPLNHAADGPVPHQFDAQKAGTPDVTKKVAADGMTKKQRGKRDKKLVRAVMKGKMPLDEARIKMGKKPRKSPEPLSPAKGAAEPDLTKSVTYMTTAEAAVLLKAEKKNSRELKALRKAVNAIADQPDPSMQAFKGMAVNPVRTKAASPAGVASIAENAERTQMMILRELESEARNSPYPERREAAWNAVLKMKGLNDLG
jgi:Double zinc ribbon